MIAAGAVSVECGEVRPDFDTSRRVADLLNLDVEVIFYDTTSLHFEIDDEDGGDQDGNVQGSRAAGKQSYAAPRLRRIARRTLGFRDELRGIWKKLRAPSRQGAGVLRGPGPLAAVPPAPT